MRGRNVATDERFARETRRNNDHEFTPRAVERSKSSRGIPIVNKHSVIFLCFTRSRAST